MQSNIIYSGLSWSLKKYSTPWWNRGFNIIESRIYILLRFNLGPYATALRNLFWRYWASWFVKKFRKLELEPLTQINSIWNNRPVNFIPIWFQSGSNLVQIWFQSGSNLNFQKFYWFDTLNSLYARNQIDPGKMETLIESRHVLQNPFHSDLKVARSQAKIYESFTNHFLKMEINNFFAL